MNAEQKKIADLMDEFDNAMLVTHADGSALRARPMHVAKSRENGDVLFLTSWSAPKVDEVLEEPAVNVTFQQPNSYLSLSGTARVTADRAKIDEAWSETMKAWFPEGKDSPDIAVVEVKAEQGEYWNMELRHRFQFVVEAGKALLTGEAIPEDGDVPGEHAKVNLD